MIRKIKIASLGAILIPLALFIGLLLIALTFTFIVFQLVIGAAALIICIFFGIPIAILLGICVLGIQLLDYLNKDAYAINRDNW